MEYVNGNQNKNISKSGFECLLFDLDDTLYPLSSGLSQACSNNIIDFMVQKLGIDEDKVADLNQMLYRDYGTSMAGLKAVGYEFENEEYHKFVHGRLPYENLKSDQILRSLLATLPLRKILFSNGDKIHVERALKRLGIDDCFETIICFETLNPKKAETGIDETEPVICKPSIFAFQQAFEIAGIKPKKTLFFDDSIRNIQSGKRVGLHTVLVGKSERQNGADYALGSIHNMKEAFPELWTELVNVDKISDCGIETFVRA